MDVGLMITALVAGLISLSIAALLGAMVGSVGTMALVIRTLQGTKLICYKKGIYAAVLLDDTVINDPNLGVILGTVMRKLDAEKRS